VSVTVCECVCVRVCLFMLSVSVCECVSLSVCLCGSESP